MGPEVWYLVYSGRVQLGPPRTPVGVPEVGVSSRTTWCGSLLADSLGRRDTPQSGISAHRYLLFIVCLIVKLFFPVLVFFLVE